jgi:hypothetical protein
MDHRPVDREECVRRGVAVSAVLPPPGPRGIVHFVLGAGRVRFTRPADAAGVTIISRLLALAARVVR